MATRFQATGRLRAVVIMTEWPNRANQLGFLETPEQVCAFRADLMAGLLIA